MLPNIYFCGFPKHLLIKKSDVCPNLSLLTSEEAFFFFFQSGSDGKASVYDAGDPGSIPGLGRSLGEGNSNPIQYYCLENPMDRGVWYGRLQCMVSQRVGHD